MVRNDRGYVLVLVLMVIALLMASGALLAGSLQYRMWLLRQETQNVHLTALTDAGVAKALDRLSVSHQWSGLPEQPFADGTLAVAVEFGDQALTRVVTVTATYQSAGRKVRALVQLSDFVPPRILSWQPLAFHPAERKLP